ncbi:uncharacterized protein LOC131251782 isoform X2 [Magnolia sinica]|uniref:uncharacterized protein LOC131251782 isoform X2 n=1 Tax=Magnolia sinica TaxID=86752 RepID=UPI00265A2790|nr:uncharacterized protein LOC131251782 isoform X2 [Magnolia sinica]
MEVMKPTSDALRNTCNSMIHHRPLEIPKEAFEIRVIYIRAVSSSDMQKTLKINFPARDPKTCLQLNGLKIDPSEKISRSLNRHRADALMSESIYVNTDRIKFSGPSLPFEVGQVGGSAALVAGFVRRVGNDGKGGPDGGDWMWVMECREGGIKEFNGGLVDVYFAGRSLGRPLLLNGVVELKRRLKGLDCIPEGDEMAIDNCKVRDMSPCNPLLQAINIYSRGSMTHPNQSWTQLSPNSTSYCKSAL